MKQGNLQKIGVMILLITLIIFCRIGLKKSFVYSCPEITRLVYSQKSSNDMLDLAGVLLGMRRVAANIAWIQLLQYYGTEESLGCDKDDHEHCRHGVNFGSGVYDKLYPLTQRVIRLDTSYYYAYLYSAGALAWNLNRVDEALALLKEGITYHPKYWQFRLYISGIIYKEGKDFDKMILILEEAIKYSDCPNMIKSILANVYEKEGRYQDSLRLWFMIRDTNDISYRARSEEKIIKLGQKLGIK